MSRRLLWLLLVFGTPDLYAQTYTEASHLILAIPDPATPFNGFTVADLNGDGRTDIYHGGRLLRQDQDGTFRDILPTSGIMVEGQSPMLALPSDPNRDGLLDILILDQAPGSRYYDNVNAERYQLANSERALNVRTLSTGGLWGDFDVDGIVDLFVGASDGQNQIWLGSADGTFTNVSATKRSPSAPGGCGMAVSDYDRDLDLDVFIPTCAGGGLANILLQYDGIRDRFNDFAQFLGINSRLTSHSAVWLDYDNDGWMDLYVANARRDIENPASHLYRNQQGTFTDVAASAGVTGPPTADRRQSVAADFNNDGWTDLYVVVEDGLDHFYLNQGNGTFVDRQADLIPHVPLATTIFAAADVNDDGWVDLLYGDALGHRLFLGAGDNHWAKIALRDPGQNRLGIGAWIEVTTGDLVQRKQLLAGAGNSSASQEPSVHFGLGTNETIDQVTITWTDGTRDTVTNLAADRVWTIGRGGVLNDPPSTFALTEPRDAAFFDTSRVSIPFSWDGAVDSEQVLYTLTVAGPGVQLRFPNLTTPSIDLDTDLLAPDQIYTWSVFASDGMSARPGMETRAFTFGDPARANATLQSPAIFNFDLPAMSSGGAAFLDVDADFDLDLLVAGATESGVITRLYRAVDQGVIETNSGAEFVFKGLVDTGSGLDPVDAPSLAVGDVNGDGLPDAMVSGLAPDSDIPRVALYNNVEGVLQSADPGIAARWGGPISIADVDADGDGDILISGSTSGTTPYLPETVLYRNEGGTFSEWTRLPGAMFGAADWADADNDGDLDLALVGDSGGGEPRGAVYRNDGGSFTPIALPQLDLVYGSVAWADYDGNGFSDLLASGGSIAPNLLEGRTLLLSQESAWSFTEVVTPLADVVAGTAAWGDYEGDGDLDIIVTGGNDLFQGLAGRVYRNEGGQFVAELDFQGALNGALALGDYNVDGDLDFLVLGLNPDGRASVSFFINQQIAEPVPVTR